MAVHIRPLSLEEVPVVVRWMNDEGWNLAEQDVLLGHMVYPQGFMAVEKDGKFAGCGSAIKLRDCGYIGSLIVDPPFRGQGLATELTRAMTSYLTADGPRNSGLLSRTNLISYYGRFGCRVPSWQSVTFKGQPDGGGLDCSGLDRYKLVPTSQVDMDHVLQYDTSIHTIPREEYVRGAQRKEGIHSYVALEGDRRIVGLATLQPAFQGYRMAPLYAENVGVAKVLLKQLLSCTDVPLLTIDTVGANPAAAELAEQCGLKEDYRLQRLYTRREIPLETGKIYGLMDTDYHFA